MSNDAKNQNRPRNWLAGFGIVAIITAMMHGVFGNTAYDGVKNGISWMKGYYNSIVHKDRIDAAQEGYLGIIEADKAYFAQNTEHARVIYNHAIDRLKFSAEGGVPRAMILLSGLYCSGRGTLVARDVVLGRHWSFEAKKNGRDTPPVPCD